jgi:hypothetical protein
MMQHMTRYLKTYKDVLVESDAFLWEMYVSSKDLNADVVDLCLISKGSPDMWFANVRWP